MKSRYSFEDRGIERQTESISECTFEDCGTDRLNLFRNVLSKTSQMIWHAYQNWKLVGNEENNIGTSHITLGGGIII